MLLKSTLLALKKSGTSCPNCGEGGGGNLDKIQKYSSFFPETVPKMIANCQHTVNSFLPPFLKTTILKGGLKGNISKPNILQTISHGRK